MAQPFDVDAAQLTGEAAIVAENVAQPVGMLATVSVSKDGTLFYSPAEVTTYQLKWFDRDGKSLGVIGQPDVYSGLRISPDGTRVAFNRRGDVWQMEFGRAVPIRVTFTERVPSEVMWSKDSQRLLYSQGGPPSLFTRGISGTDAEERVYATRDTLLPQDWSVDGTVVLYLVGSHDLSLRGQAGFWILPMSGERKPFRFDASPSREAHGQLSPDGKWVGYTANESGRDEIYVQSLTKGGDKLPVSTNGGDWVRWRRDGGELFYVAPNRKLTAVPVRRAGSSLQFGAAASLFTLPVALAASGSQQPYAYDVMPDGKRFLALSSDAQTQAQPMTVVLNWNAEVTRTKK